MIYKTGDLFNHEIKKETFVVHVNNNKGVAGAGFVIPLYNKYPLARKRYTDWYNRGKYFNNDCPELCGFGGETKFRLGEIQPVKIGDIVIVNMIAQESYQGKSPYNRPPIRYAALALCLNKVKEMCIDRDCEVVCPLIGAKLAGGNFDFIEQLLIENFYDNNIPLTVYQLPGEELR